MKSIDCPTFTLNGEAKPWIVVPSPAPTSQTDGGVPGSWFSQTIGFAHELVPDGDGDVDGDGDGDVDGVADVDDVADVDGVAETEADAESVASAGAASVRTDVADDPAVREAFATGPKATSNTSITAAVGAAPSRTRNFRMTDRAAMRRKASRTPPRRSVFITLPNPVRPCISR